MDKRFSSESSTAGSYGGGSNRDMFLKQVSKNSYKIAKPARKPIPPAAVAASMAAPASTSSVAAVPVLEHNPQPHSQQPPVYNINKNDFRDVVQKLTGSPSHERFPSPSPPVNQPRPSNSRLQRIRPPPLAQIGNRPPQLAQIVPRPASDAGQRAAGQPSTPLPPLPSVHPAAESPISAYLRFLHSTAAGAASSAPSPWNGVAPIGTRPESILPRNELGHRASHTQPFSLPPPAEFPMSAYMRFLQNSANSSAPPRWTGPPPPAPQPPNLPPQQHHHPIQSLPPSSACQSLFPTLPLSPLPFGCVPSPRSPYALHSPSLLFSPTGQLGLPQLPLSPTVPLPSPKWKSL